MKKANKMKIKIIDMSVYLIFCSFVFGCGSGDKAHVSKANESARQQSESLKLAKEADVLFDKGMSLVGKDGPTKGNEDECKKMFLSAYEKYLEIVNSDNFLEDKGKMAKVFGRAISLSENEEQKVDIAVKCFRLDIIPMLVPNTYGDSDAILKAKEIIKSQGRISTNDVNPSGEKKPSQAVSGNSYKTPKPSNSKNSAEQAIQNMKNAGTYTPEAERNIKELYNNQKKLGLVK
ncbi:MAG: hypothetical protein WCK43_09435 [bacterium]